MIGGSWFITSGISDSKSLRIWDVTGRQVRPPRTPTHPPADGEGDRLDEELADDIAALRAQGTADANFTGAFGDGRQHDVQ